MSLKTCEFCGLDYRPESGARKYCSAKCRGKAKYKRRLAVANPCSITGCHRFALSGKLCRMHAERLRKTGDPLKTKLRERHTGTSMRGYIYTMLNCVRKPEHVRIVEHVLGHALPGTAVVHHVDGNPGNNARTNLVVCQSQAYHALLHQRTRALEACGNPSRRRCRYCGVWDAVENFAQYGVRQNKFFHKDCVNAYSRSLYKRKAA